MNESAAELRQQLDAFSRQDFVTFLERCFRHLNPEQEFSPTWYIQHMAHFVTAVAVHGMHDRLLINLPPRALKSTMVSVALPAYLLGLNPTKRIVVCCYSQELSNKFGRDTRSIMQAAWYKQLFPKTRLSRNRTAEHDFNTTRGGFRLATSIGGTFTGRGGDLIIVDDPLKADDAYSDTIRKKCVHWTQTTLFHRLDLKKKGAIIVAQQRLHEDDLSGHLLRAGGWLPVILPAIAQEDQRLQLGWDFNRYVWPKGEPLDPEREDLATLGQTEREVGSAIFAAQYLQNPMPAGGDVIRTSWFRRYTDVPFHGEVTLSIDTAYKPGEHNDYSCCEVWRTVDDKFFLEHVWRRQVDYPTLKRMVRELQARFKADCILIEDKGSGQSLIQELREEGLYATPYLPSGDKETRLRVQAGKIESGRVFLPTEAHWLEAFEDEIKLFPHGVNDDQVDAMAQFLDHESKPKGGIYQLRWDRGRLVICE